MRRKHIDIFIEVLKEIKEKSGCYEERNCYDCILWETTICSMPCNQDFSKIRIALIKMQKREQIRK